MNMKKQLIIRIFPDGKIEGKTQNITGKTCEKYFNCFEKLTGASVIDSDYTNEYYETEVTLDESVNSTNNIFNGGR